MEARSVAAPERPGKNSVWTALHASRRFHYSDHGRLPDARPQPRGSGSLDPVRAAFWQAYRHLFPPHSLAAQTDNGSIVISWSVLDDPSATSPYAAPLMIRLDDGLVASMQKVDARERRKIAHDHEPELRAGMRGYDPYARLPNARVIVLG